MVIEVNTFISKFTLKKKSIVIKVGYAFAEYLLLRSSFVRICTFHKNSVMTVLKLVFPEKHFPNLGKIIIYQELFYIFQGSYGGYLKFDEEFM